MVKIICSALYIRDGNEHQNQPVNIDTGFVSFLKDIQVNDPMSEEELDYLRRVAHSLLLHQANTSTEKEEKEYLHRCHPNGI